MGLLSVKCLTLRTTAPILFDDTIFGFYLVLFILGGVYIERIELGRYLLDAHIICAGPDNDSRLGFLLRGTCQT